MKNHSSSQEAEINLENAPSQRKEMRILIAAFPIRQIAGLLFLAGWIALSFTHGKLFWSETLIASAIICGLLIVSSFDSVRTRIIKK